MDADALIDRVGHGEFTSGEGESNCQLEQLQKQVTRTTTQRNLRRFAAHAQMTGYGYVWTAPAWQGFFVVVQVGRVQLCVRPVCAIR
jgi:hypothetical protein